MLNNETIMEIRLLGAIAKGPSNSGTRDDGLICTAQAGECRSNNKYYSRGLQDEKSWSMPNANDTCLKRCTYLNKDRW